MKPLQASPLSPTDADGGDLTGTNHGGAGAGAFSPASAGVPALASAPNFENPSDNGADNGCEATRVRLGPDGARRGLAAGGGRLNAARGANRRRPRVRARRRREAPARWPGKRVEAGSMNAAQSGAPAAGRTGAGAGGYKRLFDLCAVVLLLAALLPLWIVLCAAIALAIRIEGGGPVLYRQVRLGRGGRPFRILKFRTIPEHVPGADDDPVCAAWRDAQTTAVGRVLRRFHLDELPQVVNVVRGEMSLVGPRPERPALAARIEREVPGFSRRLRVRPGIMGLAQARCRYDCDPRRKLHHDELYIRGMSPWLDLRVIGACIVRVLAGRGPADPGGPAAGERPGPTAP